MAGPRPKGVHCAGAERAHGPELVEFAVGGVATNLAVQRLGEDAEFRHVAEHQQTSAGEVGEAVDRGLDRSRIGVVAVVDHPAAMPPALEFHPPRGRRRRGQTGGDVPQTGARGGGTGRSGEGVGKVVAPCHPQLHGDFTQGCNQGEAGASLRVQHQVAGGKIRAFAGCAERQGVHTGQVGSPFADPGFVQVEHRDARGIQPTVDFTLGGSDTGDGAEALDMGGQDVVDQGHGGPRDAAQVGDFPGRAGTHFDDRKAVLRAQTEQGQGHADVVVQIPPRRQHRAAVAQDRRHHVLDPGLATTAGNRDQRAGKLVADEGRELAQGKGGIGHYPLGNGQILVGALHHQAAGLARGAGEKTMGIETLTTQGDEQIAGLQAAGIR